MLVRSRPFLNINIIKSSLLSPLYEEDDAVEKFEIEFLNIIKAPYGVAFNQGRAALLLALKSLHIKPGDEIIVQSLICRVVIDAIVESGGTPVLVDNTGPDYNVSPSDLKEKITPRTKIIIVAHLYGIPCNIQEIWEIAKENNCNLIEDCAHALGARYDSKTIGSFGDLSIFSFNFDKPISTGDGGMLVVNNYNLIDNVKKMVAEQKRVSLDAERRIVSGLILQILLTSKERYSHFLPLTFGRTLIDKNPPLCRLIDDLIRSDLSEIEIAQIISSHLERNCLITNRMLKLARRIIPFKIKILAKGLLPISAPAQIHQKTLLMNSLRAKIGLKQLENLDSVNHVRSRNAQYLAENLNPDLYYLPVIGDRKIPAYLKYTVLNQTIYPLTEISRRAEDNGFEIGNYNWPDPVHLIEPYHKRLSYDRQNLRNSENIANRLLNIPIHSYTDEHDLEKMVVLLNGFEVPTTRSRQ